MFHRVSDLEYSAPHLFMKFLPAKFFSTRPRRDRWISGLIIALTFGWVGHTRSPTDADVATPRSAVEALDLCSRSLELEPRDVSFAVNGKPLSETQAEHVEWVRRCVVPIWSASRPDAAEAAARATWWALREGIFDLNGTSAHRYSNCHEQGRDRLRSSQPLYRCSGTTWQVGLAAVQVPNYSDREVQAVLDRVFGTVDSSFTERDVLSMSARLAGFQEGTPMYDGISGARGKVRRSWLLRNPLIGMALAEKQEVQIECIRQNKRWCYTRGWSAANRFGASRADMLRSIRDLTRIYRK